MTGRLSKNFHGVGIGPLSKILAVMYVKIHVLDAVLRGEFSATQA
jgi:hypothetical protein